jgi:nucleoside-diphosphate-sugar epimerase
MKVLLTGATGAVGRALLPQLIAEGHTVIACTRNPASLPGLATLGAQPMILDALERDATIDAVCTIKPGAIIHGMTALASVKSFRNMDHALAPTNLLRTKGLDYLLEGARLAGTSRFIAQSYGGWSLERCGNSIKDESAPLTSNVPPSMEESVAAIRYLESVVPAAAFVIGTVLRYGVLYGPGTAFAKAGSMHNLVERRSLPLIGSAGGVWSFLHVEDAASAACAALRYGSAAVYNVADDDPVEVSRWLPAFAQSIGAKMPLRIPRWAGALLAGESVAMQMTDIRGMSTAKVKNELHWRPGHPVWRAGFLEDAQREGLTGA